MSAQETEQTNRLLLEISQTLSLILEELKQGVKISDEPINNYGESIGKAIQGQIIRGNRGIDIM